MRALLNFLSRPPSRFLLPACAALVTALPAPSAAAAPGPYTTVDILPVPGFGSLPESSFVGINSQGQVAGQYESGGERAVLYSSGPAVVLPVTTVGNLLSNGMAWDVNNTGTVVGHTWRNGVRVATRWTGGAQGVVVPAPAPPLHGNTVGTFAMAVNDAGWIAGYSQHAFLSEPISRPVLWRDDVPAVLAIPEGEIGEARDINTAGDVVGFSGIIYGECRPILWKAGGAPRDLGTLGGTRGFAMAVNDDGWVVGASAAAESSASRATLWKDGAVVDLSLPGWVQSHALGVNRSGVILGQYRLTADSGFRLFLHVDGVTYDFATLLPANELPYVGPETKINDSGAFPGFHWVDGAYRPVIFRPVAAAVAGFAITGLTRDASTGAVTLTWASAPGKTYRVKYSADPASGFTGDIGGVSVPAAGGEAAATSHTFANPSPGATRLFFRVEQE